MKEEKRAHSHPHKRRKEHLPRARAVARAQKLTTDTLLHTTHRDTYRHTYIHRKKENRACETMPSDTSTCRGCSRPAQNIYRE